MVSLDPPERNRAFGAAKNAGFPVLSDPKGAAARAWGVLAPGAAVARRITFYVDGGGVIRRSDEQVQPATHGADLVREIEALGLARDP